MARGVNKVILVGRLGADPEMKYSASGVAMANASVATSESWFDKQKNERVEKTEWHRIKAFRKTAEFMGEYLRKGSQVYVEGRLETRKWQDQNGQDRYITEIVVLDLQSLGSRGDDFGTRSSDVPEGFRGKQPAQQAPAPAGSGGGGGFDDDDIPF